MSDLSRLARFHRFDQRGFGRMEALFEVDLVPERPAEHGRPPISSMAYVLTQRHVQIDPEADPQALERPALRPAAIKSRRVSALPS